MSDFNMPTVEAEEAVVQQVANGTITVNGQPTNHKPSFSIGGSFNAVAKQWIDSFPSEYPYDRRRYDQGKSSFATLTIDTTKHNWSQFGYASSTKTSGSNGWIFWSKKKTTTNTWQSYSLNINETSFKSGITVNVWGIGRFPVSMGSWYTANPLRQWPVLFADSPAATTEDVQEQITSVVLAYGVETVFTLKKTAFDGVVGAISSAQSSGGSLSIFGSLYGKSDGSYSSTYESWNNIKTHSDTNTVRLLAHHNKVPVVLGTTITKISGVTV